MKHLADVWRNAIRSADVPRAIHKRDAFIAGSMMAFIDPYEGVYEVYSYGVRIATWTHAGWRVADRKYSATTSRHQRLVSEGVAQYKACDDPKCLELYSHV